MTTAPDESGGTIDGDDQSEADERQRHQEEHSTGEKQAEENRRNEPPA